MRELFMTWVGYHAYPTVHAVMSPVDAVHLLL